MPYSIEYLIDLICLFIHFVKKSVELCRKYVHTYFGEQ